MKMEEEQKTKLREKIFGKDGIIFDLIRDLSNYSEEERNKRVEIITRVFEDLQSLTK